MYIHVIVLSGVILSAPGNSNVLFPCFSKKYRHLLFNTGPGALSHPYAPAEMARGGWTLF